MTVEQEVPPSTDAPLPVIERLRSEQAPLSEWRREALARNAEGNLEDCGRILEAGLQQATEDVPSSEHAEIMQMLAAQRIRLALSAKGSHKGESKALEHLAAAQRLMDQAETADPGVGGSHVVENLVNKGFLALAQLSLDKKSASELLKRAELLFDTALKIDGTLPRALMGKAVVLSKQKTWSKALPLYRQVLARAAPSAPRGGVRLKSLKKLRFAIANAFSGLGRFEQTKNALMGVVNADNKDVESLCALAHLEAKNSRDGVGRSMEYLSEAANADQNHPVVLLQLAENAFYCGLEETEPETTNGGPEHFQTAMELLQRILSVSQSPQVRAEAHYQLGRLRHAQGNHDKAYVDFCKCKELEPEHCACLFELAQCCVKRQAFQEGAVLLETVRHLKGEVPEVLKVQTYIFLKIGGRAKDAADCAKKLLKIDPDDVDAWTMKAEAEDQLMTEQPQEVATTAQKVGLEAYENVARLLESGDASGTDSPQIWNNLGTLRHLQGDPSGAKEAYSKGLELADRRLGEGGVKGDEAKDLQIARLTMRFNRAWLAETSGDHPDYLQATQEYLAIREEHTWYSDTLIRLGNQWRRVGDTERAVETFKEAKKHGNPMLAAIMAADALRQRGQLKEALEHATNAAERATEKQYHYANVYLGNLYFELGSSPAIVAKERDKHLQSALHHFTMALSDYKDSHHAANGIGMVFAHKGKLEFARRTFQSVVQHNAMASDPSVYINLAHTHLRAGGDQNIRKAISLYQKAKKLKPNDVDIRLYLAKAQYNLGDHEKCMTILSDAMQLWPDNLVLQLNLAVVLQEYGKHSMAEGMRDKKLAKVEDAEKRFRSAVRMYQYIEQRWATLSEEARREQSQSSVELMKELSKIGENKQYADYMRDHALEQIMVRKQHQEELHARVEQLRKERAAEEETRKEEQLEEQSRQRDKDIEVEEQALNLMKEGVREIHLGRNIAAMKELTASAAAAGAKRPSKVKKLNPDVQIAAPRDGDPAALQDGAEEGEPPARGRSRAKSTARPKRESKKDKKKKDKKKKKKDKKKRKGDADSEDDSAGEADDADAAMKDTDQPEPADGESEPVLPMRDDAEGEDRACEDEAGNEAASSEDEGKKDKKKKDKKDKKDKKKKSKKGKKHKKRKRGDGDSDSGDGEESKGGDEPAAAGEDLEDELFGGE